jgi:Uma2 family endonuclease
MQGVLELPRTTDEYEPTEPEALLDSLDLPPGSKAEIIEGEVVVTPAPSFEHESYFARLSYQLNVSGWSVSGNLGVLTPLGHFIPDLTVVALDYWDRDAAEGWQLPDGIAMVIEVTATNPSNDRDSKRRGYAGAKIPLNLLIDRQRKESVLFSQPEKGDYTTRARRALGEPIPLPQPFSLTLEDIR